MNSIAKSFKNGSETGHRGLTGSRTLCYNVIVEATSVA